MALSTPPEFAGLSAPGWVNIHDVIGLPPRFSGVDSLFGDERAHTLIVGQDYGPASYVEKRRSSGDADPYRHNPKLPTNKLLADFTRARGECADIDRHDANECGYYYANAIYLLRAEGGFAGSIPLKEALKASEEPLKYVIASLSRTRRIIALGKVAFDAVLSDLNASGDWRTCLDEGRPIETDNHQIWASSHLGARGIRNRLAGASRSDCLQLIRQDWARIRMSSDNGGQIPPALCNAAD